MGLALTLQVSESDFGHELREIMATLSPEEKKEIAREVFIKQLNEVTDGQRTIKEKEEQVLPKVRESIGHYDRDKYKTDDDLRGHYKYKELMHSLKSPKEEAILAIVQAGVDEFKKLATELVQNDPKIKELWEATKDQCTADFPKYVHDAMVYYFCGHMNAMAQGIQESLRQSGNAMFNLDQIRQRLH